MNLLESNELSNVLRNDTDFWCEECFAAWGDPKAKLLCSFIDSRTKTI